MHAHFVDHRYPRHLHDYMVVGLVERGAQSYWYRGTRHTTPAGCVFLVNPGEPHTGEAAAAAGYLYRTLNISSNYLALVLKDVGSQCARPFFSGSVLDDPPLATLLFRFHRSLAARALRAEQETYLLRALARLVTQHARVTPRPVGMERPAVRRALEYMEAHFAEDLPLSKLAALASLSPYYFARSFKNEMGLPPHAYLESVRIRKAREFIDQGQCLASAALSAGYGDQSHFTRRFKRFVGITPGQYICNGKIRQD